MPGESSAVPTEDGVGPHYLETSPPAGPASVQHNPQEPVATVEAQATRRVLLENCKLVTKREDLRLQVSTGSKSGGYQSEKGDEKRAHRSHHDLTNDLNPCVLRSDGVFGNHSVLAEREPRAVIACLAAGVRSLREEFGDIAYFMQDAAPHDLDVHKSLEVATGRYRAFFVHVVEHLANLGSLRPDLTPRDAADICWFYFGYWGYYTLHNENGWPYERAEAWLYDMATAALLKD